MMKRRKRGIMTKNNQRTKKNGGEADGEEGVKKSVRKGGAEKKKR